MVKTKILKRKGLIIITIFLIALSLLLGTLSILNNNPPIEKIEQSRKLIARAIEAEANIYSPKELNLAETYWKKAMENWKLNNDKTSLFRKFDETNVLADLAIENAKISRTKAIQRKNQIKGEVERNISDFKIKLNYVEFATSKLPLNHNIRKNLTPITIILNEAEMAYARNNLITARDRLESISQKVDNLNKKTTNLLDDYFKDYNKWVDLNEAMRKWSKENNSVSLVVDKFSRTCTVYKAGKILREFNVELSVNWLGDKIQSGDKATPEGKYLISLKKSGKKTIYHKSLEINFPNTEDKLRFEQEKSKGKIPINAKIGGSIAIHGGGGRGIDWTDGCIALENSDMDKLYSLCSVGTPVAIVGSLVSLNKIFEEFQNE
jgi:hypothetical protein